MEGYGTNPIGYFITVLGSLALIGISIAALVINVNTLHDVREMQKLATDTNADVLAIKKDVGRVWRDLEAQGITVKGHDTTLATLGASIKTDIDLVRQDLEKHSESQLSTSLLSSPFVGGARAGPPIADYSVDGPTTSNEPLVLEANYTLNKNYNTREDMLASENWRCYMGRSANWDPNTLLAGLDWYSSDEFTIKDLADASLVLQDPTNGVHSYELGCRYKDLLITDRPKTSGGENQTGFMLKAFHTASSGVKVPDPSGHYTYPGMIATLRLEGLDLYPATTARGGLFAIKVHKLPTGCGAWPAFWLTSSTVTSDTWGTQQTQGGGFQSGWPVGGEIDMLEQANGENNNHVTLHTPPNCDVNSGASTGGRPFETDCNTPGGEIPAAAGCSVQQATSTGSQAIIDSENQTVKGVIYLCDWIVSEQIQCWTVSGSKIKDVEAWLETTPHGSRDDLLSAVGESPYSYHILKGGCNNTNEFVKQHLVINTAVCGSFPEQTACNKEGPVKFAANTPHACPKAVHDALFNAVSEIDLIETYNTEDGFMKDLQWEIEYIKTFDVL